MAKILKAAPVTQKIKDSLKEEILSLAKKNIIPNLKVILVGEHKPSLIYTANKKKLVESLGAKCEIIRLPGDISEGDFLTKVKSINEDSEVHGTFVQLPVPDHLSHLDLGSLVSPEKDIDGFHAKNIYQMITGRDLEKTLLPCTPKGIITILKDNNIELEGKHVVVIGRSMIVGKPMGILALNHNATVTYCHSRTPDLASFTKEADIIISAVGKPKFIDETYLRNSHDQILIDVGINHDSEGKLCGDMNFEKIQDKCQAITPVPGGIGPMTIISLAQNLVLATKNQH